MNTDSRKSIRAIFTDLDDTLTDQSQIHPDTYSALWKLKEKGLWLVVVSGRPAGWADCLMRLWPLDAMVFENGAGITIKEGHKLKSIHLATDKNLQEQRKILQQIFDRLQKKIPALKLATDQPFRLYDFAIDFAEEPPHLSREETVRILEDIAKEREITIKQSSIHLNYWYGYHTKVSACQHLLETEGKKRGIAKQQVLYCGDSPNDEPLFGYFEHTWGVANIRRFLEGMKFRPRSITQNEGGKGFQEIASYLLY